MNVLLSQRRNVVRPVLKRLFINCLLLICRRYVVSCKRDLKGRLDYRYHIAIQVCSGRNAARNPADKIGIESIA